MAPKQSEKIDNPPIASSSEEDEEEEEEESGSSGSESSDEEADLQSKLTQTTVTSLPAKKKKPESDSEEEEEVESDSDSDSEPPTKTKLLNTVAVKPETSISAAKPPESSTNKRSLKQSESESESKKKMKISGEEAKKMFQRLFSETDEIAMLQGFIDFTSTRGDPYENMDAFSDYVKTLIDFNATKAQIVTKLQRCKKKFVNIVKNSLKKGKSEGEIRCVKDLDHKGFELSRKIWGINGFLPAKARTKSKKKAKLGSSKKEGGEEERDELMANDSYANLSISREIGLFFKGESGVCGLDETRIALGWDMVEDGPKKRDVEEKLKKLKAKQMELCLLKMSLAEITAKMIFKDIASSSSSR
ncbi:unnamed protein product [Cochlearia groenlandica]